MAAVTRSIDEANNDYQHARVRREDAREEARLAGEKLETVSVDLAKVKTQVSDAESELRNLEKRQREFADLTAEIDRLEARKAELEASLPDLEVRVRVARAELAKAEDDRQAEAENVAGLTGQKSVLETRIAELKVEQSALIGARNAAQASANEADATLGDLKKIQAEADAAFKAQSDRLARLDELIAARRATLADLNQLVSDAAEPVEAAEPPSAPADLPQPEEIEQGQTDADR